MLPYETRLNTFSVRSLIKKISVLCIRACLNVCPAFQYLDRFTDLRVDKTWQYEICATGERACIRTFR